MRRYRVPFVIGAVLGCATFACAQASISVGDEVVFSGGPSQPPRSIQTGFTLETSNMRLSGSGQGEGAKRGKARRGAGDAAAAASTAGGGDDVTASVGQDGRPPDKLPYICGPRDGQGQDRTPARPPMDLSGLATDDLVARAGDPDPRARSAVAAAMAGRTQAGDRAVARRTLEELVADAEPAVTQSALDGLAKFGDPTAGPQAMKLVFDTNDDTAIAAIKAVASLGYRTAIPELTKLADRDMGRVGQTARKAVGDLSAPPSPAPDAAPQLTPKGP